MNVMLDENYNVKLIDFGDAKCVNEAIDEDQDFYEELDDIENSISNSKKSDDDGWKERKKPEKDLDDSLEFELDLTIEVEVGGGEK